MPGGHILPAEAFRSQYNTANQLTNLQRAIEQNGNSSSNILDTIDKIHKLQQISVNHQGLARNSTIDNIHTPIPGQTPAP